MTTKRTSRPAATGNGSLNTKLRIIIADQRFRNKVYLAAMRGSVLGSVLAIIVGILHMDTAILEGAIIASVGCLWLGVFYLINSDDRMFGG